ncbi:glycoside hydrolase family 28 protein [Mollisia scopiformis]|uniref:Glycoside hydrolase family 28 protein n=1 Tax=Mollisia scopiformis TaxID=149040 RepID=A0A194XH45_MOLSC|nr:glycoside hydrolase family 28 protein [Mollisia scopiformis]KUJ19449.1 glycoside hydrolase family 28 protein [Mollisia scopiformis]
MTTIIISIVYAALALPFLANAQLSGTVGPLTTRAEKAATKVCNILDYGGVASATTDNSAAITSAWAACVDGGEVYIPSGKYGLGTWITLSGGSAISINLEGIIYRTGTASGNMIYIENTKDFEFYSGTSAGAIQGYGYEFATGECYTPRILRLYEVTDFSVHDFVLVDSPQYHLTFDTCTNGEVYNMVIRGGNEGGLDGIDVWGTNIWVHDVEVTNKDECVTVKSPASYIMVENIFCNWSGGCAIGSLGADTAIFNVEYNHIYSQNCNQMFMIKSNGGSGSVYNCAFNNFMGHTNAYTLDVNAYWTDETLAAGDGVEYYDLSFEHWHGTCADGENRAPIQVLCPSEVPCYDITIDAFYIWTESGDEELYKCENAYGSGPCLNDGTSYSTYTTTYTVTTMSDYTYTTMAGELSSGLGITASIAIPTIPASFFPSITPYSTLLG